LLKSGEEDNSNKWWCFNWQYIVELCQKNYTKLSFQNFSIYGVHFLWHHDLVFREELSVETIGRNCSCNFFYWIFNRESTSCMQYMTKEQCDNQF